ncbi:MAG: enoyl-ACP reductase [Rickettsiales bacterium]|jgi:enoyl-[acyl-carrier protein] reductase I|nr:enoyl-ACP reductase [Rickettsiales bacterium]
MLLKGKKGLIIGLSNDISIAWGIAKQCSENGAELCIMYQNEPMKKRAVPLAEKVGCDFTVQCDFQNKEEVSNLIEEVKRRWGVLDFIVHSIAFAPKDDLRCEYNKITEGGFGTAMNISVYSFLKFTSDLAPLMENRGGSVLTLTYYGGEKVIKNYRLMGTCKAALDSCVKELAADLGPKKIRVNAISAGPIRTLASSGIAEFTDLLKAFEERAPLGRTCTIYEVGNSAVYLLSDLASAVTGEIHHVDCGYHAIG